MGLDEELTALEKTLTIKTKFLSENTHKIQKINHETDNIKEEIDKYNAILHRLKSEHPWIMEHHQNFGKPGTPYDYNSEIDNITHIRMEIAKLKERAKSMKQHHNSTVRNVIDTMEKKEEELKKMIRTLEKDKSKIETTIVQLDEYKKKKLEETWVKVSR